MSKSILVIEDDAYKSDQIVRFAKSVDNDIYICKKESLNSALLEVSKNNYDLIVLDMSLPTFDKNETDNFKPYGGLLFLDEVKRKKYKFPIVIVTQYATFGEGNNETPFELIDEKCKKEYANYKEIIYFLDESWKEKLRKYIIGDKYD